MSAHISIRDHLSGCAIQIRKHISDGTWSANLETPYGFGCIDGRFYVEAEYADDPAAAVMRLARKLQELPQ